MFLLNNPIYSSSSIIISSFNIDLSKSFPNLSLSEFNKPFLIGAHISEGTKLPSGEKISGIIKKIDHKNLLGLILACVSPENFEININELKKLDVPYGFKMNAFQTTKI